MIYTEPQPAQTALTDDLSHRLREIPVWMVGAMTPGWQEHGTTAYHAADLITEMCEVLADARFRWWGNEPCNDPLARRFDTAIAKARGEQA